MMLFLVFNVLHNAADMRAADAKGGIVVLPAEEAVLGEVLADEC